MDLFHRQRNKYYALIRQWYSDGLLTPDNEIKRKKASQSAKDSLVNYDYILTLQLHEPKYCFSCFSHEFTPVLPLLFTELEKKYLKTLLEQEENRIFKHWIGEDATATLTQYLVGTESFPISFFEDMSKKGQKSTITQFKEIIEIYQGIVEKRLISFIYHGTDGVFHEKQNYYPFQLLFDKENHQWQLLAFTVEDQREVVCNLERMEELTIKNINFSENLQSWLQENRNDEELLLQLRPDKNSIERSFLIFHDYQITPHYDSNQDEYHLSIQFNPHWDTEDLFSKVLSLGSAVKVLSPTTFQQKIIEELKKML